MKFAAPTFKSCGSVIALVFATVAGSHAGPNLSVGSATVAVSALESRLNQADAAIVPVAELLKNFADAVPGAPQLAVPLKSPQVASPGIANAKPAAERLDVRLMLAMLQQQRGGKDNFDILRLFAEDETEVLLVRDGLVTPATLAALFEQAGFGSASAADGVVHRPVVIWKDAILKISEEDPLNLSRQSGAFVLNFGRLIVDGGTIRGVGAQSELSPEFQPFVISMDSGSLHAHGGTFENLGFGNTQKYSGISILANPFRISAGSDTIENSTFNNIVGLSIVGSPNIKIRGNRLSDLRGNALQIAGSSNAVIEGNVFFGSAPTNAIRILANSDNVQVRGNAILGGGRAGIVIQDKSDAPVVTGNLIWKRLGGGIKLRGAHCGYLANNVILDNKQKGIEIRGSDNVLLRDNLVSGNDNSGIWISDQGEQATTMIDGNLLAGNGAGISGATAAQIISRLNDITGQFPRIFGGDLATNSARNFPALGGDVFQTFSSAGIAAGASDIDLGCEQHALVGQ